MQNSDNGHQPIAIGRLSDSGDLKMLDSISTGYVLIIIKVHVIAKNKPKTITIITDPRFGQAYH